MGPDGARPMSGVHRDKVLLALFRPPPRATMTIGGVPMRALRALLPLGLVGLPLQLVPGAVPAAAHPRCTVVGTAGPDVLTGTDGPDVICGARGKDTLIGLDGDDILIGGRGSDVLKGFHGNDRL